MHIQSSSPSDEVHVPHFPSGIEVVTAGYVIYFTNLREGSLCIPGQKL